MAWQSVVAALALLPVTLNNRLLGRSSLTYTVAALSVSSAFAYFADATSGSSVKCSGPAFTACVDPLPSFDFCANFRDRAVSMNAGFLAALAAIARSFVGALGSVLGTLITQRHQDRRDVLAKKVIRREALYSDFIGESARPLVDSLEHNMNDPQKLIPVYALLSRIRISSSQRVLGTAEKVIKLILTRYQQPNLTAEQIQSRAVQGENPLREFGDACRIELDSMQKQL